ncbi:unnamed protein product [Diabrotica balteata]|uniref:Fatty acyl-CoA reductase n=1 Tax=Diabrotica balteata TaxID=107213 RepID=A0A9N9STB5_DIABA|nr:unnamed protein product [Diabrotica balteata]
MDPTPIQQFYKDASVFITGGTGFMGKILVEKLLRSTEVGTLYLLVREKKGKRKDDRITEVFDDVVFRKLKSEKPKFKHRVQAISGDLMLPNLGLSESDRQLLISKVNVIIHMGATIKFNESISSALHANVYSTKVVIDLAKEMKQLKSIVYVSTAYSNCTQSEVEERLYDPPISYEESMELVEKLSPKELEKSTSRLIGKWPNTYTFTKCIAESLVNKEGNELPIAIFRPSIVESTYREPIEGWKNNFYGASGFYSALYTGFLQVNISNRDVVLDIIPVDMAISALVACAWDVSLKNNNRTSSDIPVYNYVSGPENPLLLGELTDIFLIYARRYPSAQTLWKPHIIWANYYKFSVLSFFLHTIPACILDILAICTFNKPRIMDAYKKIHSSIISTAPFATKGWKFRNDNVQKVWLGMDHRDKETFFFNMRDVNWTCFIRSYVMGIRKYILKDSDKTLQAAKRKYKWLSIFNTTARWLMIIFIYNIFLRLFKAMMNK